MSQPSLESASVPSFIHKKPVLDVYTVMLIVALVSLLMACLFLYLEINIRRREKQFLELYMGCFDLAVRCCHTHRPSEQTPPQQILHQNHHKNSHSIKCTL